MEFQPTGDIGLILGVTLALLGAGTAFWYYLRETRSMAGGWMMAGIRSLVVALLVMMFVEPVLRTQEYIGQRGRLFLLLDQSRSMSLQDRNPDSGKALQLLMQYDLIDTDQVNSPLPEASRLIKHASNELKKLTTRSGNQTDVDDLTPEVSSKLRTVSGLVEDAGAEHIKAGRTERGKILFELWKNVSGNADDLNVLRNADRFPDEPDEVKTLDEFSSPRNRGDKYGTRIRGYLIPPESGSYRFWLTSDDAGALYLSTDDNPDNSRRIARVQDHADYDNWENTDDQKSKPVQLQAGNRYYVETLHLEAGGNDHVRVGWTRPGGSKQRPIPGQYLAPVSHGQPASPEKRRSRLVKQLNDLADELEAVASRSESNESDDDSRNKLAEIQEQLSDARQMIEASVTSLADRLFSEKHPDWESSLQALKELTRWDRLRKILTEQDPSMLTRLSEEHEVELWSVGGKQPERLWKPDEQNDDLDWSELTPEQVSTNLTAGLRNVVEQTSGDRRTATVLISDGQHNKGSTPEDPAIVLGQRDIPVHTLGIGAEEQPQDMSVIDVQSPETVFYKDQVKGTIILQDRMPAGKSVKVQIHSDEHQVWETSVRTKGNGRRKVSYDFPIEELMESVESAGDTQETISRALSFEVRVQTLRDEQNHENNTRAFYTSVVTQKQRVLLIDGRSRWEYRYVRNLFERDPLWKVESRIFNDDQKTEQQTTSPEEVRFHEKQPGAYDLVIFGDVPSDRFFEQQLNWFKEFVNRRGGGIIFVDGQNGHLRTYSDTPIDALFPVDREESNPLPSGALPDRLRLAQSGKRQSAFLLASNRTMTQHLLRILPAPHWTAPVSARPGTETMLEARYKDETILPVAVHRRSGAGQVLYLATDELWRWRYEVADRYHHRFWNQVARWVQEKPYMVRNDFMALGTDRAMYNKGDKGNIRARLFIDTPPETVQAIIRRNDRTESTVQLERVSERRKLYRGDTPELSEGEYEISLAVEDMRSDREVRQKVPVAPPENREFIELNQDRELLERISAKSGGTYLPEELSGRLPDLLESLSSGHWERNEIALWQSWWLFVPVVVLLSLEWILRKWYGLV